MYRFRSAAARVAAVGLGLSALMLAGCSADPAGGDGSGKVVLTVEPSAIPAFVAEREGLFEGVDVEVSTVGYEEAESLLVAGKTHIAWMGPLDAAQFSSEGEDFRYLTTAGALNMYNGVAVRAEDATKYGSVADLKGKTLGIPGFGTGTWASFQVFATTFYDIKDPENDFNVVTADSGALLAMLEKGEIDGALVFAAQAAAARYMDEFHTVFSFTEVMQERLGQPLVVNGAVVSEKWLKANPEAAAAVVAGLDAAVAWMKDNPDAFLPDGKYADLAKGDGWHRSVESTEGILALVGEGMWFLSSDHYTGAWQEAVYQIIKAGEGTLVDTVPPLEEIFAPASTS